MGYRIDRGGERTRHAHTHGQRGVSPLTAQSRSRTANGAPPSPRSSRRTTGARRGSRRSTRRTARSVHLVTFVNRDRGRDTPSRACHGATVLDVAPREECWDSLSNKASVATEIYIYTRGATTAQNGACVPPFAHHATSRVVTTATRHVRATRRTTAFATTTTRRPDARRARLPRARRRAQGGRRHVEGGALLRRGRARRVPRRRMRAKRLGAERPARAPGPARRRRRRRRWRGRRGLARGRRGRVAELPDVRADVRRRRGARGISRRLACGCCRVIWIESSRVPGTAGAHVASRHCCRAVSLCCRALTYSVRLVAFCRAR